MFLDEFDHIIKISIHALREEGDPPSPARPGTRCNFNPRPPRGGRLGIHGVSSTSPIFQSTPSARRATRAAGRCEGGDVLFQSTPSARRATQYLPARLQSKEISIHALREEGDGVGIDQSGHVQISIHALREEGDSCRRG